MATSIYNSLDEIQQSFARSVLDSYVAAWMGGNPPVICLSGAGGTGKSTAIAAALELIEDWLSARFEELTQNVRNAIDAFTPEEAKARIQAAPSDSVRRIIANLYADSAVVRRKTASEIKDEELLKQTEAVMFAVQTEVVDVDF